MCGIFASLSIDSVQNDQYLGTLEAAHLSLIRRRGPDALNSHCIKLAMGADHYTLQCHASVLALRGEVTSQPMISETGDVFCWNGEIFHGIEVGAFENDGKKIFDGLEAAQNHTDIYQMISQIHGPFAFVFWKDSLKTLFFARDFFGRRSLLHTPDMSIESPFILSSVTCTSALNIEELSCKGIYSIELNSLKQHRNWQDAIHVARWSDISPRLMSFAQLNRDIPLSPNYPLWDSSDLLIGFYSVLSESVRRRVSMISHAMTTNAILHQSSAVALLFSGGLDSVVLAALMHNHIPSEQSIDLINVSFHTIGKNEMSRDRVTGYRAHSCLQRLYPHRKWKFVEIDVQWETVEIYRDHIRQLRIPCDNFLDDSIGVPLWFAARGEGKWNDEPYSSLSKILLVGMGADEQLGGYARHRRCFDGNGWCGLLDELQLDLSRISHRNLGRDDRCISDLGKEARFPYLDEDVVCFLSDLPVWKKMDFSSPKGQGEKRLLRDLARIVLKMDEEVVSAHKCAIQDGTKFTKLEKFERKLGAKFPAS